jgi:hypothetical protein
MANLVADSVRDNLSTCLARLPFFLPARTLVELLELEVLLRFTDGMAMLHLVAILVAVAEVRCFTPMNSSSSLITRCHSVFCVSDKP